MALHFAKEASAKNSIVSLLRNYQVRRQSTTDQMTSKARNHHRWR